MAFSPMYDCQFVLVTNEAAVLNAWSGVMAAKPSDSGRWSWSRRNRYRNSTPTKEKASTALR